MPSPHELLAPFLAGIASSLHCLGMCGPLALTAGGAAGGVRGGLTFLVAKTCSYLFLGAFLGLGGGLLAAAGTPALLRAGLVVTGLWFLVLGAELVRPGLLRLPGVAAGSLPARVKELGASLPRRGPAAALALGMLAGWLPCPLSWGMASWAAATGSPLTGAALMVSFGLGTAPALLATAIAGRRLRMASRPWLRRAAGLLWVLLGALVLARGLLPGPPPCC